MKSRPRTAALKKEDMNAVRDAIASEGEILRQIQDANEGHEALWPEEQYSKDDDP